MSNIKDSDLLLQRFYHFLDKNPDRTYLFQPHSGGQVTEYSFQQVFDQAARMASYLNSLGLEHQSKIAILSKNCAHFFMAELAIWMAGHVTVALYPTLNEETVQFILEHSESKLLFVGKLDEGPWKEMKPAIPEGLECVAFPLSPDGESYTKWEDITSKQEPVEGRPTRGADEHSLIIYTSGSTGRPKGVLHSFRTISVPTVGLSKILEMTPEDRHISYLPLAHGMDRWLSACMSLYNGSQVYFAESLPTFVQDLKRARPTVFVSVPRLWLKFQLGVMAKMSPFAQFLMKLPVIGGVIKKKVLEGLGLGHARFAGSGSAPIPGELIQWYRDLGLELLEGYGMSENFNYSHLTMPGRGRVGYIGHPYPDVEHRLSEEGEIQVKSPGTMLGYYKAEDLTKECFTEDGWLKTGDRGEIDSDGRLKITGRVKELFKTSKGKYVAPAPIENIINVNPNVELSLVSGSGYPETYAVVQLAEELLPKLGNAGEKERITKELTELLHSTNAEIEHHEKIGFIVIASERWTIEDGQLTPTQKIKRNAIESQYEDKVDGWYAAGEKVIWA